MKRTLTKDTIRMVEGEVMLYGWVASVRDHGKITFFDVRDRSGIVQCVHQGKKYEIHREDVVEVLGLVRNRPEKLINPKIATGKIEVEVSSLKILSKANELPFPLDGDGYKIDEELRLQYRYLDLRRERLTQNIRNRSKLLHLVRQFFISQDFVEIETPLLTKSTPEGSRDFLVPSRLQPGFFYALPQSPQQYKQLLMVAGFERYFQIARCLRDEDLRSDRGFEHTQVDIEMSFVNREDVMEILEKMIISVFEELGQKIKEKPFPVFTYREVMEKYGADKFDLRSDEDKKNNVKAFAWVIDFPFFEKDKDGKWTFTHNPFSNPKPEFIQDLLAKKNIAEILTTQYDLVCNGYEVGGGSIRSNEPKVLETVFEVMGYTTKKIQEQFGHMFKAFTFGAPPHGGCAFGVERLMMILSNETLLREVVAFPQTSGGRTAVMDAPSKLEEEQLEELGIKVLGKRKYTDVFESIKYLLDAKKIQYKIILHDAVYTSSEAAKVRGTLLHQGAKALIMKADSNSIMVVLAADRKLDTKTFKQRYKVKDLHMAEKDEVKIITGVEIGAVPPFSSLFGIPLYIDESLMDNKDIVFNAGKHTVSILMKLSDYITIEKGTVGKFSTIS